MFLRLIKKITMLYFNVHNCLTKNTVFNNCKNKKIEQGVPNLNSILELCFLS